ncbi:MAG: energy transducer TonB [Candidatus Acidiferrum sp.]
MGILPVGSSGNFEDHSESWIHRVSGNLRQAIRGAKTRPSSANGAPIHFNVIDLSERRAGAQTFSAGAHVVILLVMLFAIASAPNHGSLRKLIPLDSGRKLLAYIPSPDTQSTGRPSLGSEGGGGEQDPRPARFGNLAPRSSMPLVPPRLNRNEDEALPAPPAVFDPNAPADVATVTHLGLPWMNADTDSAGPGKHHGFGSGDGGAMGDSNGDGAGAGEDNGPYANVVSPVACLYCPEPGYTEEARKAKLQGKMLLQVLVGTDGAAKKIQVLHGLGMGLDERAIETVRRWRFSPGRDASKRPVTAWVTIETHFQLF